MSSVGGVSVAGRRSASSAGVATHCARAQTAQLDAAQLRNRLDGLVRSEETARAEARTGREELKRVRKEWLRLRDELEQEQGEHKKLKVRSP